MPSFHNGSVEIAYLDEGEGLPIVLVHGFASTKEVNWVNPGWFSTLKRAGRRVIALDDRGHGQSSKLYDPAEYHTTLMAEDVRALMDHLGIKQFMVIGFCIGGPMVWNLIKNAPQRVVAGVLAQPTGFDPKNPNYYTESNMRVWGPELLKRRPDITPEMLDRFLGKIFRTNPDFVFTVTRDFVRNCQTPVLILPDDIPAHPYAVAMEAALLAPKAEVSIFPWKEPKERIPLAVRQIRSFLKAHQPT